VIKLSFPLSAERCARLGLGTFRNRAKEIFKQKYIYSRKYSRKYSRNSRYEYNNNYKFSVQFPSSKCVSQVQMVSGIVVAK